MNNMLWALQNEAADILFYRLQADLLMLEARTGIKVWFERRDVGHKIAVLFDIPDGKVGGSFPVTFTAFEILCSLDPSKQDE